MNIFFPALLFACIVSTTTVFAQSASYSERKAQQISGRSPFQDVLDGKFPEQIVYQDSEIVAFKPNSLQLPIHILIVPRKRIPTLNDATEADMHLIGTMMLKAKDIAKQLGIAETGYRLALNTNEDAGQSVFHIHLHLLGGYKTGPMVDQTWRTQNGKPAQTRQYDLFALAQSNGLRLHNRTIIPFAEGAYKGFRFSEAKNDGIAWLDGVNFSNGVIEFDVRGRDVFQKSFVGVAFHGANDSTFDAVYFRPFNFHATDSVRRIHAVQYVSLPEFTWKKLREERNGIFEKSLENPPNPNGWFHVKVVVQFPRVEVFVDNRKQASLSIVQLSKRATGRIGLYVADASNGDFANLVIVGE